MPNTTYYNNADLFGKYPPPYYLNRAHHFGEINASDVGGLQDLIDYITNLINDISIGGIGGITTDLSTSHVWYDTTLAPTTTMLVTVGGYPAGTTAADVYGQNLRTILDTLLFGGAVYPSLTPPSASFSSNGTVIYEIGSIINISFTTSFDRGSINPQYTATSPYRSGLPNYYDYTYSGTGSGALTDTASSSLTNVQSLTGYVIQTGNQSWSSAVSYDVGVQPYDAMGNPYDSPLAAGTLNATPTITIEGVYPLFATTVSINTLTQQPLVSMNADPAPNSNGFTLVPETGGEKQKFEIPNAWTGLPLVGIESYNTTANAWLYQGGSAVTSLTMWTTSSVTHTIQGNTINYTRYTYNGVDRSSIRVRLQF